MTDHHEKRKSRRHTALKPTFIGLKGYPLKVYDICNEGVGIVLPEDGPSFAVGELLPEIPIPLESGTVNLKGVVSHVSYTGMGKLCGIHFRFEGEEYDIIIRFIRERLLKADNKEV